MRASRSGLIGDLPKPTAWVRRASTSRLPIIRATVEYLGSAIFRLHHHGMVSFSQRVNVPVGPSGPSSATRTTSREPSSTEAVPSYPLRFVFVHRGYVLTRRQRIFGNHQCLCGEELAERVGFEPTLPFRVNTLSKRAPSATRPSLRRKPQLGDSSPEGYRGTRSRLKLSPT